MLRVEEAKHLLETTWETTDPIAHRVGYEDASARVFLEVHAGFSAQ